MYRREFEKALKVHATATHTLANMGVDAGTVELDAAEATAAYEARFRDRLTQAQSISHPARSDASCDRSEGHRKAQPFDANGSGYRDSLIWEHVLIAAAEDDVVLTSNNSRDFATSKETPEELATELVEDLERAKLPGRVTLVTRLRDAVRRHVQPSAGALTRMKAVAEQQAFTSLFYEAVNDNLMHRDLSAGDSRSLQSFDDEERRTLDVDEVQIDGVHDVRDLEIDEAYDSADGRITFNFGATADIEVDFFVYKFQ